MLLASPVVVNIVFCSQVLISSLILVSLCKSQISRDILDGHVYDTVASSFSKCDPGSAYRSLKAFQGFHQAKNILKIMPRCCLPSTLTALYVCSGVLQRWQDVWQAMSVRAEGVGACVFLCSCFKNVSPLTSKVANGCNPHKQNSLRFSVTFNL